MRWQFGGNLEPVRMICEIDWKECPTAVASYIWNEIVTDVLDCLTNEEAIWRIIAVILVCMVLLRITYSNVRRVNQVALNNETLSKVGCKIEDLELKVNILTYKMQYGTWPLPHQFRSSGLKKELHNVRLTLSNPVDRNVWIKELLLSPTKNKSYVSFRKVDPSSAHRLTELYNVKEYTSSDFEQRISPFYSDVKASKTSSDGSIKKNSQLEQLNNRNVKSLSLLLKANGQTKSKSKTQKRSKFSTTRVHSLPCEEFTNSINECRWFLKELKNSNKNMDLAYSSSETNVACSEIEYSKTQPSSPHRTDNALNDTGENERETKAKQRNRRNKKSKAPDEEYSYENDLNSLNPTLVKDANKNVLPSTLNITFCRETQPKRSTVKALTNVSIPPTTKRRETLQTSEETLHRVKKLESLYNALRTYEAQNFEVGNGRKDTESNEMQNICRNVASTINAITNEIESIHQRKNRAGSGTAALDNLPVGIRICHSISETMKNTQNTESQDDSNESWKDENKMCDYQIRTVPETICYSFSSDSFENDYPENKIFSAKKIVEIKNDDTRRPTWSLFSKNYNEYPVPIDTDDDPISPVSSRTEVSRDSDSENKSTTLLLQEALNFKRALLSRVQSEKFNVERTTEEGGFVTEHSDWPNLKNDLKSKLLDIIAEEQSAGSSTEKSSRTYIFLKVEQQNELSEHSIKIINADASNKDKELSARYSSKRILASKSSEYFSLGNINQKAREICNNESIAHERQRDEISEVIPVGSKVKDLKVAKDTEGNNVEELLCEVPKMDNINELIFHSVRSIKDYTELFSQNQKEAIVTARKALQNGDNGMRESQAVETCSNESTKQLVTVPNNECDQISIGNDNTVDNGPNLTLKRHLGKFSLAKDPSETNIPKSSIITETVENESDTMIEEILDESVSSKKMKLASLDNGPNFVNTTSSLVIELNSDNHKEDLKELNVNLNESDIMPIEVESSNENNIEANANSDTKEAPALTMNENQTLDLIQIKEIENTSLTPNKTDLSIISSNIDVSNETSTLYVDASSHDFITSSGISLSSDKSILNQPRNKTTSYLTIKSTDHKSESRKIPTTMQGSSNSLSNRQLKRESNLSLSRSKDRDSSVESRSYSGQSNSNLCQRRSLSHVEARRTGSSLKHTGADRKESNDKCESMLDNNGSRNEKFKLKTQSKCLIPTPRTSSKSCIPILKSRLEAARREDRETRSKSPKRGPLTMTTLWKDESSIKDQDRTVMQTEGTLKEEDKIIEATIFNIPILRAEEQLSSKEQSVDKDASIIGKNCDVIPQGRTVMYVNIVTEHNRIMTRILDPKKFLQYIKDRELKVQNIIKEDRSEVKLSPKRLSSTSVQEDNVTPKILTIISSVIAEKDITKCDIDQDVMQLENVPSTDNILSSSKLKNSWSLTVEQKEIEVTAKPSMADTSTSISDLRDASPMPKNSIEKFQIFGTPKELTENEYVALLETLIQKSSIIHLQDMQNVCNKLRLKPLVT